MRKKTRNTLAAGTLVAVMASSVITGCQRGQSTTAQTTNTQTEEAGKANTETTGEGKGSEDVHGTGMTPIDNYPVSSLTITCPIGAGGGTDLLLRAMTPAMKKYLGVPVMIASKPGGGFAIGYAVALQDSNDGSSISAALSELPGLPYVADVSFDYTDFEPICSFNSTFGTLSVSSSAPYDTVREFVEHRRASPSTVRIGDSGIGGVWHILAAPFAQGAGIEVVHVPFDGGGPATVAVAGNNVEAVPASAQGVQTYMEGGMVRILCPFSPERLPELPDIPTDIECGYPTQMMVFRDLLTSKDISEDIKTMIDIATRYALADEAVQEFVKAQNYTNNYMNTGELREVMDRENVVYAEQSEALGIAVK